MLRVFSTTVFIVAAKILTNFDNAKPFEKRMKKKCTWWFRYAVSDIHAQRHGGIPDVIVMLKKDNHEQVAKWILYKTCRILLQET